MKGCAKGSQKSSSEIGFGVLGCRVKGLGFEGLNFTI